MDHLINAIVVLRNNQGQFATCFPLESLLELVAHRPEIIDLTALVAAITQHVSGAVSTSVAAAFEQDDDRRVQIESRQLINTVVALASSDRSGWERAEARALTRDALDNLTRCQMRLARATNRVPASLFDLENEHAKQGELAAHGLAIASLSLSVRAIMEAVPIICHLAGSATEGRVDEHHVVEDELQLALDGLRKHLQHIIRMRPDGLLPDSPLLWLHHDQIMHGSQHFERAAISVSKELAVWLDVIEMSEADMLKDYNCVHPSEWNRGRRFQVSHERVNTTALLYWQLRCLMQWFREYKADANRLARSDAASLMPLHP